MGGQGSGRISVKGRAVYCLLGVQMDIQKVIHEGVDDQRVQRADLKDMLVDCVKKIKVAQEEIEGI